MIYNFETFLQSDIKNELELDKIYTYEKDFDKKTLIKKFKATKTNNSTSLFSEKQDGKFGVEILNIPRFYVVYLGLVVGGMEENKFKFSVKIFDTYGKQVDNIEGNNLLNIKGLNLRVYLPSYTREDDVSIYYKKEQEFTFKNKLEYNDNMECFETNYKGEIGEFEIKAYGRNRKIEHRNNEEPILNTVKNEEEPVEKGDSSWRIIWIVLIVIGALFILILIIYYFSSSKSYKPNEFDMISYGTTHPMRVLSEPNPYTNPITAMTPRYRPGKIPRYMDSRMY